MRAHADRRKRARLALRLVRAVSHGSGLPQISAPPGGAVRRLCESETTSSTRLVSRRRGHGIASRQSVDVETNVFLYSFTYSSSPVKSSRPRLEVSSWQTSSSSAAL